VTVAPSKTDQDLAKRIRELLVDVTREYQDSNHWDARAIAGHVALAAATRLFLANGVRQFSVADIERDGWVQKSKLQAEPALEHDRRAIWQSYHYVAHLADEARLYVRSNIKQGPQPGSVLSGRYEQLREATSAARVRLTKMIACIERLV